MKKMNLTAAIRMKQTMQLSGYFLIALSCLLLFNAVTSFAQPTDIESPTAGYDLIAAPNQVPIVNTYCPVMPDMKTVKNLFSDYKGKRVYFCCVNCRVTFNNNPEKYIDRLPQFGAVVTDTGLDDDEHTFELTPGTLIKPMGIITLSLLVLTVIVGLFRRRLPKLLLKWHKCLGIITLISALIHAALVIMAHRF
jgi:YHS domain-containing protein